MDGSDPRGSRGMAENGFALAMQAGACDWDTELWGYVRRFSAELPGQAAGTVVRYRLSLEETGGDEIFADGGAYHAFYVDDDPLPDWSRDAVVYQIFVDRFFPGAGRAWADPATPAGFYGGRLTGITEKLDYIAGMGFNCLWLTPIFASPSHHGYDMSSLFEIEPRLGSLEDFHELVEQAHRRGLRILLDFVPNHWSNQHANFQEALRDPASPYRDWFIFKHWPDDYETFFGVKELPQVNLRNPQARAYMLEAARYWLEQGADGYRVDYAIGPAPDFWADFRRVTRAAKADCWTFGEIVDPPDVQISFAGQLDGSLDFMLLEALRQALAFGRWDGVKLAGFLQRHFAYFGPEFSLPSFLDNHDMNRFLWAAGGEVRRLRLAALLQFALPGPPVVYYGTEVGLSQVRDVRQGTRGLPEESRLPMLWEEQQDGELREFYRELICLREQFAALRRGSWRLLEANPDTLVFERELGVERMIAVLNLSERDQTVSLPEGTRELRIASNGAALMRNKGLGLPALSGAMVSLTK